jgi:hypothetical protein
MKIEFAEDIIKTVLYMGNFQVISRTLKSHSAITYLGSDPDWALIS